MALLPLQKWRTTIASVLPPLLPARSFRSDAALEALTKASLDKVPNLVLYNYPSFSGAFSALFAHLFHSRLHLPCLVLPFSSVHPFRSHFFSLYFLPLLKVGIFFIFYFALIIYYLVLSLKFFYRAEDLCIEGLETCYLFDFIGPKGFAQELLRRCSCK